MILGQAGGRAGGAAARKAAEGRARGRGRAASSLETASRGYMTPPNFLVLPASSHLYPGVKLPRPGLWHPTRTGPGRRSRPLPSPISSGPERLRFGCVPRARGSPRPSRAASPRRRGLQGTYLGPLGEIALFFSGSKTRPLTPFSDPFLSDEWSFEEPVVLSMRPSFSSHCFPSAVLQVRGLETRPA